MDHHSNELSYSSIRDNKKRGTVGQFLRENIKPGSDLAIVSAFFTIYTYRNLKYKLDSINSLRFLFGEPTFLSSLDPSKVNRRDFKIEDDQLVIPLENRLQQKSAARECAAWLRDKADIKSMVKPNFLHGKMYHITQPNGVEKAIMGSSNFTVNGLGIGGTPNIELNMIVDNDRDRNDLKTWFNDLWNDSSGLVEDVKAEVLKYLEQLYIENEPEFIYFKTLFHVFEKYLDEQQKTGLLTQQTGFFESEIWNMLYEFQKDGVKGAINKILKHNGCIIADSVGLGKTFEALAVIRYFELLNFRVLVLCPKKLSNNWSIYQSGQNHSLNPFRKDKFSYHLLYHTDLGRITGRSDANGIDLENFNWSAYDLVVIDESHNFRGNPMEITRDDGTTRMNRAKWLMEKIIRSGVKTRVLMLSATPVNNNLKDLRNQISLITEGRNDAMLESSGIKDIALTIKNAQTQFTNWADTKKNPRKKQNELIQRLGSDFIKLLDELTIARSRKHIINFYNAEAEAGKFPERLRPLTVYPNIDLKNRFYTYDEVNRIILEYKLSIFNPSGYVKPEHLQKYEQMDSKRAVQAFKQSDREHFLIGMMKVNFLKRLESSIESFEISLDRTIRKIEEREEKIRKFMDSGRTSLVETLESWQPADNELEEADDDPEQWQVGKKLKFDLADLDLDAWLNDLERDREALVRLYNFAAAVTPERDAKLRDLKSLITHKLKNPVNEGNKKVIVFTAFADTANYLYEELKPWVTRELGLHMAMVAGSQTKTTFDRNEYSAILVNFSPFSKNRSQMKSMPQEDEIDILIATDCISEGQNLQDCDFLINYDIHWNPVRIIQRFGRIDRLGSKNRRIQLVNFWPTKDLDNYINLKERVEARMALVDVTATADDNVLAVGQIEELIEDDLKYRNAQLKKLKDEILDLEDMDDSISLTDFTLDDFRIELLSYINNNEKKLKDAPLGLYAVVPAPGGEYANLLHNARFTQAEEEIIRPGVVFCLKQKGDTEGNEAINPLQPYFLVYIRNDGLVRFNYTHPKQILEMYRLLCAGNYRPFVELCDLFNTETHNGAEMQDYTVLLSKAIEEIGRMFNKRSSLKLTGSDRGALLIPKTKRINDGGSFELVTWLVIK